MAAKKVKVIDLHEQYKKLNKVSKGISSFGSIVGITAALIVIAIGVLAMLEVIPSLTFTVRSYRCVFLDYNEEIIADKTFKRGEKFEIDVNLDDYKERPESEDGTTYTFIGWDTNQDNIPDVLPNKMYYSFTATPVYFEFNPHGVITDKTEDETPNEDPMEAHYENE